MQSVQRKVFSSLGGHAMAAILMIDDSPTVCLAVKAELLLDNHTVHRLESTIDAPNYLNQNHIDLIILDLQMPRISGFGIGALLKFFDKKKTPILIYSSRPLNELKMVAGLIGAVAFCEKMQPLKELRNLVSKIVGHQSYEETLRNKTDEHQTI